MHLGIRFLYSGLETDGHSSRLIFLSLVLVFYFLFLSYIVFADYVPSLKLLIFM
jgi:hypothetical protein